MKKMRKLTRRSYNRKLLVFGLSMFMAVAMISTGFAAWVMSSTEAANANGGVTVGIVNNEMMLVEVDNLDKETGKLDIDPLLFDAKEGDTNGRVKASEGSKENLSFTISGYVTNAASLSVLYIKVALPEGLQDALKANYIEITSAGADAYDEETGVFVYEAPLSGERDGITGSKEFTYTLTFAWGDFFGGLNPSEFYDSDEKRIESEEEGLAGNKIESQTMANEMEAFATTIRNGMTPDGEETPRSYSGDIKITVSVDPIS